MKATIRERVSGARLRDAVPPLYRDEIVKGIDPAGVYTLVLSSLAHRLHLRLHLHLHPRLRHHSKLQPHR